MYVDSHCHLDDQRYADDLNAVIDRALEAGVTKMLSIGTGDGPPGIDCAIKIADHHENVYASIGVHPHDAAKVTPQTFDDLGTLAKNPKVIAFGEIGLDYHYDFSPREVQREVFVAQLKLARELNLPIIIHTREAWADTMQILRQHGAPSGTIAGIMHCFTGDPAQAQEALDLGLHLAFGGAVTFKTADQIRESARITPDDRLLIETDAPYMAPVPHRGKRNEPAFMLGTAGKLAELRATTPEHIGQITTANFERLMQRRGGLH
jgi:TatD DNase family protein